MADRKDEGGGGEPLDKVLSKLDSLGKRMDALETGAGSKNPLKADKGRKDDDDDDRKDAEGEEGEDKKSDGEEGEGKKPFPGAAEPFKGDKKKDAEGEEGEEGEKKPPPLAADKRKDQGSAPPAAATKTPPPPVSDKKSDDDDDKKSDDDDDKRGDSRADAAFKSSMERRLAEQDREIKRLTALMKPRSDDEHAAFADAQSKADAVFAGFGQRAPRPLEGETHLAYRKRLATLLKPYSAKWKGVKFSEVPEAAFGIAEEMVYADAVAAAANPTDLGDGELREVARTDPRTGQKTIMFYGKDSFVKSMGRPARRVTSFRTQSAV